MIGWWVGWWVVRLVGGLIDWLVGWLIDGFIACLVVLLLFRLVWKLVDFRFTIWLNVKLSFRFPAKLMLSFKEAASQVRNRRSAGVVWKLLKANICRK